MLSVVSTKAKLGENDSKDFEDGKNFNYQPEFADLQESSLVLKD